MMVCCQKGPCQGGHSAQSALEHSRSILGRSLVPSHLRLLLGTPKPQEEAFLSPNRKKKRYLQLLRQKSPQQSRIFLDICIAKIASFVAGRIKEYERFA